MNTCMSSRRRDEMYCATFGSPEFLPYQKTKFLQSLNATCFLTPQPPPIGNAGRPALAVVSCCLHSTYSVNRSEYKSVTNHYSHQSHHVIYHRISSSTGTLAEWLTRCPAKAIPSGACVRITQVSELRNSLLSFWWLVGRSFNHQMGLAEC